MFRVTYLGDSVEQGTLPVRLEYNMEVGSGASGWVAQSLPVEWNVVPGVHYLHVVPRCDGRCEVGEGHYCEEEDHKDPEVLHEYKTIAKTIARNVQIGRLEIQRGSGTLRTWLRGRVFIVHFAVRTKVGAMRGSR